MGTLVQNRQVLLRTLSSSKSSSTYKVNHWSVIGSVNMASAAVEFQIARRGVGDEYSPCADPALDCDIWGNLQPELVSRILSHLPLTALIHTRLVSKRWDREVYAGRVLGDHELVRDLSSRSWLFLFENGGPGRPHKLHAFDPSPQGDWRTFTTVPHFATVQKIGGLSLCGAASGLMVYAISALKSHFTRFGVFNPITRSWKKLPPLLKRRQRPVVSMFTEGGHYKLVVAGGLAYDQQVQTTEVYDSRTECWRTTCEKFHNQRGHNHVCDELRTSTAFCDGTVYHMRFTQMLSFDPNRDNHTFMAYDTKSARWRSLRVSLPPGLVFTEYPSLKRMWNGRIRLADVLPPFLVESNGRLLLVGFRDDRFASSIAGVVIWELDLKLKLWKPVTVMPDALFSQMCPKVCTSPYVDPPSYLKYELQGAGHGDIVYIFQANEQGLVVLCDFSQSPPSWRSTRKPGECSQNLQGCVIDLRLDTMI